MSTIFEKLIFTYENEHDLVHDSTKLDLYSSPKIYSAGGDLSKRWYVYFSFRNPETGKLERMKNIYGKANRYKTKEKRWAILTSYRKNLVKLLKEGFNPFEDNTERYQNWVNQKDVANNKKAIPKSNTQIENNIKESTNDISVDLIENAKNHNFGNGKSDIAIPELKEQENNSMKLQKAFDLALKLKANEVSERTINDYTSKSNIFLKWLKSHREEKEFINQITKKDVVDFFNHILLKTSPRNRNNYRADLGSIFQVLKENEIIEENFVRSIRKLKSIAKKNKAYTQTEQEKIFTFLEKENPMLLLYIKFIAYGFFRPVEVCRLRIRDIDIKNKIIQYQSKNKKLKTKIIPDILLKEIPNLTSFDENSFLFTPSGIGKEWNTDESNKRGYFTMLFKKKVKDVLKLDKEQGLYSFRHTFIMKLYKKLREKNSPEKVKSDLMLITGHSSMKALESYLRDIDAELPEDYSNLF